MVAISDVAKKAGVAVGTVSRVINGHPSVSPELRERVERVVAELGYRPNAFARSLRRQRSLTFGLVVPDVTEPFFAELVKHVEELAAQQGYCVFLCNTNNRTDLQRRYIAELSGRRTDGLLLVPTEDTTREALRVPLPLVVLDRTIPGCAVVATDHRRGAADAVTYLVRHGHRRIACIAWPEHLAVARERLAGYRDAIAELPERFRLPEDAQVRHSPFEVDGGYRAALDLLGRRSRPTALFASSDRQAIGALRAAADLGLDVPSRLSIVGFDDIPLARHLHPRLTTLRQDAGAIAAGALAALQAQIGDDGGTPTTVLIPGRLQIRDSAAAPPPGRHRPSPTGRPAGRPGATEP